MNLDLDTVIACPWCGANLYQPSGGGSGHWTCNRDGCFWSTAGYTDDPSERPTWRWLAKHDRAAAALAAEVDRLTADLRLSEGRETDARLKLGDAYRLIHRLRHPGTIRGWIGRIVGGGE